jgi:hypothetical protein
MKIHRDFSQAGHNTEPSDAAKFIWLAILTLAGVGGSLVISCIAPFVALAVALAGTVRLTLALRAMIVIWLANQLIGFSLFNFPRTANTILWGFAIGMAALLTTSVASLAMNRLRRLSIFVRLTLAFGLGFVGYQGTLMLASLVLGGQETFMPAVIAQVLVVNAAWLAGLIILNELMSVLARRLIGKMPRLIKAW